MGEIIDGMSQDATTELEETRTIVRKYQQVVQEGKETLKDTLNQSDEATDEQVSALIMQNLVCVGFEPTMISSTCTCSTIYNVHVHVHVVCSGNLLNSPCINFNVLYSQVTYTVSLCIQCLMPLIKAAGCSVAVKYLE